MKQSHARKTAVAAIVTLSTMTTAFPLSAEPKDADRGLKISLAVEAEAVSAEEPLLATVTLTNIAHEPLLVLSHIKTHETHLDWYHFRLAHFEPDKQGRCDAAHARRVERKLDLWDDRDKSVPVRRTLAPGESITHTVDLQAWAKRRTNGAKPIAPGPYTVYVNYAVRAEEETPRYKVWTGTLEAHGVPVQVSGPIPRDYCPSRPPSTP